MRIAEAASGKRDGDGAAVSVVIPAHNAAQWIAEAVQSALDQTCPPREIIVVDDGSTDDTWRVAGRFPPPVRVVRKPNGGPASARNFGIAAACGTWIALLDADDRWLANKLERQLALATPGVDLVHTLEVGEGEEDPPETLGFAALWQGNLIANSSVLVRRATVIAQGGFDEDPRLKSVEDYHLWLRLASSGAGIVLCKEPLTVYRRGVGLSSNTAKFLDASLYNIEKLGHQLQLPAEMVRARKLKIMDQFGRAFLHQRQIGAARAILGEAFSTAPGPGRAVNLGIAYLPRWLLDLRRDLLRRNRQPPAAGEPQGQFEANGASPIRADEPPYLLAVIDTEEEFDWGAPPPSRAAIGNLREQAAAQKIFDRFGIVPTYAVDYPVASRPDGFKPLAELAQDGRCEIGAHLHPWVNPPVEEERNERNSFPGNLPRQLERAKLIRLTETIEANFGRKPLLYRAGRYGLGPHTFETLAELGYQIDCSILPFVDLTDKEGPDYTDCGNDLSWVGPGRRLLEMPVTTAVIGGLANGNRGFYRAAFSRRAERAHLPGALARLRLLDRIRLTPEGTSLAEAMRLTDAMVRQGQRVFVISYHSSSLKIGETRYVRSAADLARFLSWIEGFLEHFFGKHNGRAATPEIILRRARAAAPRSGAAATGVPA
ncbi:MAG TPA: glycosyltransferase [Stellaceae bacterium]|nr:glycosyltransferase [Stellaceae bacterium]